MTMESPFTQLPVSLAENRFRSRQEGQETTRRAAMLRALRKGITEYGLPFIAINGMVAGGVALRDRFAMSPEAVLSAEAQMPSESKKTRAEVLKTMAAETGDLSGPVRQQRRYDARRQAEKEGKREMVQLKGFEALRIPTEYIQEYLEAAFPQTWLESTSVSEIVLNPHFVPINYPGLEGKPEAAHCFVPSDGSPARIEITSESFKAPDVKDVKFLFRRLLPHELGHAVDTSSSTTLSSGQALHLGYQNLTQSLSPGRPKKGSFDYPESIHPLSGHLTPSDKGSRAVEGFAVSVEEAFALQGESSLKIGSWDQWKRAMAKRLIDFDADPMDAAEKTETLKWFFQHTDPEQEFKPWERAERVKRIEDKIIAEFVYQWFDRVEDEIGDELFAREVHSMLTTPQDAFSEREQKFLSTWYGEIITQEGKFIDSRTSKLSTSIRAGLSPLELQGLETWISVVDTAVRVRGQHWNATEVPNDLTSVVRMLQQAQPVWSMLDEKQLKRVRDRAMKYLDEIGMAGGTIEL